MVLILYESLHHYHDLQTKANIISIIFTEANELLIVAKRSLAMKGLFQMWDVIHFYCLNFFPLLP